MRAVRFLVVEGKVLEEGVHALGLGALDFLGDQRSGQDRILREVLEVTSRVGVAELRPETWTRLMVAVMRLPVGPDPGILPGSGP